MDPAARATAIIVAASRAVRGKRQIMDRLDGALTNRARGLASAVVASAVLHRGLRRRPAILIRPRPSAMAGAGARPCCGFVRIDTAISCGGLGLLKQWC